MIEPVEQQPVYEGAYGRWFVTGSSLCQGHITKDNAQSCAREWAWQLTQQKERPQGLTT